MWVEAREREKNKEKHVNRDNVPDIGPENSRVRKGGGPR
jgi:hypothetical protein